MPDHNLFDVVLLDEVDGMYDLYYGPVSIMLTQDEIDELHAVLGDHCSACAEPSAGGVSWRCVHEVDDCYGAVERLEEKVARLEVAVNLLKLKTGVL